MSQRGTVCVWRNGCGSGLSHGADCRWRCEADGEGGDMELLSSPVRADESRDGCESQVCSNNKERRVAGRHVTILMRPLLGFIHFHVVVFQLNAKLCTRSITSHSKARKESGFCKRVLMKTLLCVHVFTHTRGCVCVCQRACCLLSASERLISLIAARRTPSTRRLHGKAGKNTWPK